MGDLWLAFEGGGTKTRVLLATPEGAVLARETGGSSSSLYISRGPYARRTRGLLDRIKAEADAAGGRVTRAGLAAPMVVDLVIELIRRVFGDVEVVHTNEAEIARACHGLTWGVTMIAGTGATCAALDRQGRFVTCGGFGPQFGDEGSGYWIGREAIAAAMRMRDGRGPTTALERRLCDFYRIEHIMRIIEENSENSGHVPGPRVAACVPVVFEAAREGDGVARRICRAAGNALGRIIVKTTRRLEFPSRAIPLVLSGGVFHGGALVIDPLRQTLERSPYRFKVYPPVVEPGEGILKVMQRLS